MDWTPWIERGVVRQLDEGGKEPALQICRIAWDKVVASRAAYLRNDWGTADTELRDAFILGTKAIMLRHEMEPIGEYDFELSQRLNRAIFHERMIDGIYERARILRSMLPLEDEIPEQTARLVRRSVAASSEYVALVEGFVYQ